MSRLRSRWFAVLAVLLACSEGEPPPVRTGTTAHRPLRVHVVNYPLAYVAERIGGDEVTVVLPAPSAVDPALWSPDPEIIAGYQAADLILLNGAGYAGWVRWATLPPKKLVDTSSAFRERLIPIGDGPTHQHGPAGEHSHGETAITTWLDPQLAILQARSVGEAFAAARPAAAGRFRARLAALEADLEAIDRRLAAAAEELGEEPLLFSHPVYQYLQRRYALNGRSLHWEPDADPGAAEWRALGGVLAAHPARLMLWEAEPRQETRKRLATLGVSVAVFEPCGNVPQDGDYLAVMDRNARAFTRAWAHARSGRP